MLKTDRALKEVWDWKDTIYRTSKDKSVHGIVQTIRKEVASLEKFKTLLKTLPSRGRE